MNSPWWTQARIRTLARWEFARYPAISQRWPQPCAEAQALIDQLGLQPLEPEGGWFRRTWSSDRRILLGQGEERLLGTSIYFLITSAVFSRIHQVPGPELFHFYQGDPVELFDFNPSGGIERRLLGADPSQGQSHQVLVPGGHWQACRVAGQGRFALLGTTMSPGFADEDFRLAGREDMRPWMAEAGGLIEQLLAATS
ncbi:MAG: cupin domain-containing protein [Gammaproteobacteria bacterium]